MDFLNKSRRKENNHGNYGKHNLLDYKAGWNTQFSRHFRCYYLCSGCIKPYHIIFLISVFIPTTKEMAMIKVLPAISNSKFMSEELPKDIREVYLMAKDAVKEKLVGEKK